MSVSRIVSLAVVVFLLSACTPPMAIKVEDVPKDGRYTVLVRETGDIHLQHVGTTIFSNARHRLPSQTDTGTRLAQDAVRALDTLSGYEFVDLDLQPDSMVLPGFYVNSYDGSFGVRQTEGYKADQRALDEKLRQLSEQENLRFIIVLSEWGSGDRASRSNQPLIGNGVHFRSFFGSRFIAAHSIFRLRLYDAATGMSNYWSKTYLKELPKDAWIDLGQESPPDEGDITSFLDAIESTIEEGASHELLCVVGLMPAPVKDRYQSPFHACKEAYAEN